MWSRGFPWSLEGYSYGPLTNIARELMPDISEDEYDDMMGETARRFLRFPHLEDG